MALTWFSRAANDVEKVGTMAEAGTPSIPSLVGVADSPSLDFSPSDSDELLLMTLSDSEVRVSGACGPGETPGDMREGGNGLGFIMAVGINKIGELTTCGGVPAVDVGGGIRCGRAG